jgi:hypothetical protein
MLKANYSKLNYKQSLGGGGGEIKPWPQRSCPCNKEDMHSHIRKDPTNNPTLKHPTQHPKKHPLLAFLSNKLTTWHWLSQKNQNMLWLLMACINKSQHNFNTIFLLKISMLKLFYQSTWYLTFRSFQRRITFSYGKLKRLEK